MTENEQLDRTYEDIYKKSKHILNQMYNEKDEMKKLELYCQYQQQIFVDQQIDRLHKIKKQQGGNTRNDDIVRELMEMKEKKTINAIEEVDEVSTFKVVMPSVKELIKEGKYLQSWTSKNISKGEKNVKILHRRK